MMDRKSVTVTSLIGLALAMVAWGLSYLHITYYSQNHSYLLALSSGQVMWFDTAHGASFSVPVGRGFYEAFVITNPGVSTFGFQTFYTHVMPPVIEKDTLQLPLWIPAVIFSTPLLLRLAPSWRRKKRRSTGLCIACGYRLESLMVPRCPECGTPFERKKQASHEPEVTS